MSDSARAISILRQARDILSERLVQHVSENQEAILADALGLDYSGEIDSVYEQLGARLLHVNTMLSQLPSPPPSDSGDTDDLASSTDLPPHTPYVQSETATMGLLAAPQPSDDVSTAVETTAVGPGNWETLVGHVRAHDVDTAAALLADYLGLDVARAARCAETFHRRADATPELVAKAMRLGAEIGRGSVNASVMLLWECFGLQGAEAITAMHSLKLRLATAP